MFEKLVTGRQKTILPFQVLSIFFLGSSHGSKRLNHHFHHFFNFMGK